MNTETRVSSFESQGEKASHQYDGALFIERAKKLKD
ncbi:hypothetical protein HNQ84_002218 [Anoxybacillus eryuanensis]